MIDDQQLSQSEMRQDDNLPLVAQCSQPHNIVDECSEAVDTSNSTELVIPGTTNPLSLDKELIANHIKSLLSSLRNGGDVKSAQAIINVHGRIVVIILTQDNAFYEDCLHKGRSIELPDYIASCRDYLSSRGIPSAAHALMIDNQPTIVGLVLLQVHTYRYNI